MLLNQTLLFTGKESYPTFVSIFTFFSTILHGILGKIGYL